MSADQNGVLVFFKKMGLGAECSGQGGLAALRGLQRGWCLGRGLDQGLPPPSVISMPGLPG